MQINDKILISGDNTGVYLWSIEEIITYKQIPMNVKNLQNLIFSSNYIENDETFTFYNQEKSQIFVVDSDSAQILKRIQI